MAATNEFTYPYNPSGVLDECNITGETHTITPGTSNNYNWFVPNAAPFFGFSVVLKHVASGKTLTRGVDYNLGLEYHQFNTQVTLRPVYGAIVLIDTSLTGQFEMDYMTVGGQYAIDANKALELMANAAIDPRTTRWDSVTDIPSQFPVTEHLHDVSDITGMADVVDAIKALTAAMLSGSGKWFQSLNEHLNDFNDPHHVLDMISDGGTGQSIAKSTQQQAMEGTDNASYMTPLRVAQYAATNILNLLSQHTADKNNPHGVTKEQVGLDLVENLALATTSDVDGNTNLGNYATLDVVIYAAQLAIRTYETAYANQLATQQDAEQGTNNIKWMSPLRVAQFVAAGVGLALQNHVDAVGNVHGLTAQDLGLENVANYRPTTEADITNQANLDNTVTTPGIVSLIVKKALDAAGAGDGLTQQDLENYVRSVLGNVPNYAAADYSNVQDPTATDKLMTPAMSKAMVDVYGGIQLLGVCQTAEEVSAYQAQDTQQQPLVDLVGNQVWEYSADTDTWAVTDGLTVQSQLMDSVTYMNPVSFIAYKCLDAATPTLLKIIERNVTVSTSAPPTDTSAYRDGHVWYQVS